MKKIFTSFFLLCLFVVTSAQWSPTSFRGDKIRGSSEIKNYYSLDIPLLKSQLANAQETGKNARPVTISLPTMDGKIERFAVYSFPVVVKELADEYQLGSYVGVGIDDPGKYLRFSLAPNDFQSMIIKNGIAEFVEPLNREKTVYGVHPKTDKSKEGFLCSMNESLLDKEKINKLYQKGSAFSNQTTNFAKSSDKKYRTMRLVMSVTGEYTQFHGGTVPGAMAAINATLTRVNGVFEKDFALHLNLQNFPGVIYTNPATDPYSPAAAGAGGAWNLELQNTLTANVGNANYDIGHLFGASGGGGNAGCIGCVCVDPTTGVPKGKGSGYTSPADGIPQGDNFDIDYVAHEMGHQLGANHTFSHGLEGTGVNMEPGSGSTIMGYAGITGANTDVQPHSDDYFHIASIKQVQANLISKTCDVETTVANNPPVISALPTYNIPKGTAFVLTASATDAENDPMTYTWEEVDNASVTINKNNLGTTTSGATFRSVLPTTSPTRYFPKLSSVLAGVLNNSNNGWESVSNVARTTKFSVTVRDNSPIANQQQTQFAEQTIIVGSAGPFKVTTATAYNNGPSTVTWDVVNTTAAPYSVANVKIDYTTDNGVTWNVLAPSTPNDGSESLTFGALTLGSTVKIRVSAIGNVFYAIGSATVASLAACTGAAPTGITVSAVTQTQATVSWAASAGATYVVQYRPVGSTTWITVNATTNTTVLTGLTDGIQYEVQVANVCSGTQGTFSASVNFTTPGLNYCQMQSSNSNDEYIANVTVTPTGAAVMSNTSLGTTYTDYTTTPSALVNLVIGSANNTISVSKGWTGSTYSEAVNVWIDFNRNGIFETNEQVMTSPASTTTPVTATFPVPANAYNGPSTTRMRVALSFSSPSVMCQNFTYGEVEDYAVKLIQPIPCTSNAPLNLSVTNITATSAYVMWDPAVGATYILEYRAVGATAWIPVPLTTSAYTITGLTESSQYEVRVAYICSGTTGTFTAPVQFSTPAVNYCTVTGNSTNGYISNVKMTPTNSYIMNNDSGANSYTDYSVDPTKLITLVRGSANNAISVSKSWITPSTFPPSLAVGAWIDFNRNGIFENNERVINSTTSTTTPITATYTVPNTSYNGPLTLRMRVIISSSNINDPCVNVTNGEVEDYAVKIVDLQPCSTAAPSPISVTGVSASTATVSWLNSTGATYVLRYKATAAAAWTTVNPVPAPGNTYTILNLNATTAYEVQVATICGGNQGPWSTSVNFTTLAVSYCNSGTATVGDGYINNVTVTPTNSIMMINNSGATTYTDYSTDPTKLITFVRGSTGNNISIGRVILSSTYATSVWIDYNGDGVFDNGTERVMNLGYSSTTPVTATFTVPANAYTGTNIVKMRVIVYYNTIDNACQNLTSNGEVEDYAVKFVDIQPCTTAPPSNITVSNITATTANVSWLASTGATYVLRWRLGATGAWTTIDPVLAPGNSYTITGLTELTGYQVQVATRCSGTLGAFSASIPFTTTAISYCNMTGTGTNDYIANVTVTSVNPGIAPMSNTSLQTNYISYTTPATLINLELGSTGNKIAVTKGWAGATNSDAVSAWIDFNRNGVFETNEQIMAVASNSTSTVNALFNVPSTAYSGPLTTTMRVVLKRSSSPVMCQVAVNGEVEDYAVRIRPCATGTPTNLAFNTITHTSAIVNWNGVTNGLTYILQYRPLGSTTWTSINVSTLLGNPPIQLTGLTPATTYEVQVAASCGTTPGTFTAIKTFSTRCDPTPPTVTISNVTTNSALVTWAPIAPSSTYVLRYRVVGTTTWVDVTVPVTPGNSYQLTGLSPYTTYEVQVANKCVGETTINPYSNPKVFTTERTCELPPPGLTITNLTPTTAVVVWDPFPGATYILRYRKVGIPSWTTVPVATNTLTLTGLTELTKYELQVANICSGTPGTYTQPYFFTTPTVIYCQMSSGSSVSEYISNVTVKPTGKPQMSNDSNAQNYSDFTGDPTKFIELIQGSTGNEISIAKSWTGTTNNEGIAVWIDFDRSGTFDPNERILVSSPNSTTPVKGTFSVPADAFISMTDFKYVVMRVAMQKDAIPVNCISFANGEVEDYTVRISKQAVPNPVNQTEILIYPNPVSSILYVKNISKKANYKLYNAAGQLVSGGIILNNKIDVSGLINGVYVIDIDDVQGTAQKKFIKE